MKKALTLVSIIAGSITGAVAQIQIGVSTTGSTANGNGLLSLLALAQTILNRLVPFAIGLAVLAFFWFLIKMIWASDSPDAKNNNIKGITFSIVALFLMVAVWGVIGLLANMIGVNVGGVVPIPAIPQPN